MANFANASSADRANPRFRGMDMPKLSFLPPSHFLPSQHPFDAPAVADNDIDIDMDLDMDGIGSSVPAQDNGPFLSAHPSPEVSDDSDFDHDQLQLQGQDPSPSRDHDHDHTTADGATKGTRKQKAYFREQIKGGLSLTHDMLLAPIPVPQARAAAPYSPFGSLQDGKRASFSMHTPPGSTPSSFQATVMPCSDAAEVDALIRASVRPGMSSHGSDRAFFWSLGKLSEFSFSDRFVRSKVFDVKGLSGSGARALDEAGSELSASLTLPTPLSADKHYHMDSPAAAVAISPSSAQTRASPMLTACTSLGADTNANTSQWRLRLYPHGRGDRYRDSEYVGLYLQQEPHPAVFHRRGSHISSPISASTMSNFSSSAPHGCRPALRRSISSASSVRRHVTLFIATENGDCLAKQDMVDWFSGSEGGLGFPKLISRKAVQDIVCKPSYLLDEDEEENGELNIVAGVIFHDL